MWLKFDDQFPDHPKLVQAGPLAGWLHVCAICYCGRYLTDGFLPHGIVKQLANFEHIGISTAGAMDGLVEFGHDVEILELVERLVDAGLWESCDGGFLVHDYLEYNPSRAEVIALREQRAKAGQRGGLAKARALAKQNSSNDVAKQEQNSSKTLAVPVPVPVLTTTTNTEFAGILERNGVIFGNQTQAELWYSILELTDNMDLVRRAFEDAARQGRRPTAGYISRIVKDCLDEGRMPGEWPGAAEEEEKEARAPPAVRKVVFNPVTEQYIDTLTGDVVGEDSESAARTPPAEQGC